MGATGGGGGGVGGGLGGIASSDPAEAHAALDRAMRNHPPEGEAVEEVFDGLTARGLGYGHWIIGNVPRCPDRTVALGKLQECLMWAKKAVAVNQHLILEQAAQEWEIFEQAARERESEREREAEGGS